MPDGMKLTVRQGGAVGEPTADYTAQLLVFGEGDMSSAIISGGASFGQGTQWEFVLDDDTAEIPRADLTKSLAGHNQITWSETIGGVEYVLAYGRFAYKNVSANESYPRRQHKVVAEDINAELNLLTLREAWVRPAETGRTRVLAALAAFCNGSPRLTTVIATHLVAAGDEVLMPSKTYPASTELPEIFADCATVEGKVGGPVIHTEVGVGSHKCYLYKLPTDHTTYVCPIVINSDDVTALDVDSTTAPVVPAIWGQGQATQENPQDLANVIVSRYGTGDDSFVVVEDTANQADYDYAAIPFNDSISVTAAQATARASAMLGTRKNERVTHTPSIMLKREQVPLLAAGMSITFRSSAMMGGVYLDTDQTRTIASVKWTPDSGPANAPAYYRADLELDRPFRIVPEGTGGTVMPSPPTPAATASCSLSPEQMTAISTPNGGFENGDTTNWTFDQISGGIYTAGGPSGDPQAGTYAYQLNGTGWWDYELPSGQVFTAGQTYVARFWYQTTDNETQIVFGTVGDRTVDTHVPTGTATDGPWISACVAWTPATTVSSGVHVNQGTYAIRVLNIDSLQIYTGSPGDTTEPVGEEGSGTPGTGTGTFAPINHVHAHGNLADDADYHDADQVGIDDAGGYFTSDDVEGAEQEIGARLATGGEIDGNARIGVRKNSTGSTFERRRVNLIEGTGVTLTVTDDSGNEEVDVTIAASGGGGSGIAVEDEGVEEGTGIDRLNFTGAGVSVSVTGTEATVDVPGGGGAGAPSLPLDADAAAAIGSGDDFAGTTLDGGWSSLDTTALTTIDASIEGYLVLGNSAAIGNGVLRGIKRSFSPAGDFTIWMRVDNLRVPGNFVGFSVFAGATDPSNASGAKRIDAVIYDSSGGVRCQINKWASGVGSNVVDASIGATPLWLDESNSGRVFPVWLGLRRVGANFSVGVSQDGVELTWHTTTTTIDFSVATFGIGLMQQSSSLVRCAFIDYIATEG